MASRGRLAGAAGHAHVQAAIVGMQHAADGAQMFEGPVLYGGFPRASDDAHAYRAFAVELAMCATTHLPEPLDTLGHHAVVGPAQTTVGAEAHERRQHQSRRIAQPGMEVQT